MNQEERIRRAAQTVMEDEAMDQGERRLLVARWTANMLVDAGGWALNHRQGFDLLMALEAALDQLHLHLIHQTELPPDDST